MTRLCLFLCAAALFASPVLAENRFTLGGEWMRDHYEEPSATVITNTDYGSITAGYEHSRNNFFSAIDGRYSRGSSDYKSVSGILNGTPEWETDFRLRTGLDLMMWHGHLMPYVGVGWRYYFDEGKGRQTNTGALAYDRHISQFYIPLGATFRFTSGSWTFAPNAEFDLLAYGQVNTHLAPIGADQNITNQQHTGWGARGEFMAGQQYKYFGWEAGPFVRYWNIDDSSCKATPISVQSGECLLEPKNTRLQAGAAFRVNF